MLRRFGVGRAKVSSSIYGVSYKCEVFDACDRTPPAHSVAELIGPFDASNEAFTMQNIVEWMSRFFDAEQSLAVDCEYRLLSCYLNPVQGFSYAAICNQWRCPF